MQNSTVEKQSDAELPIPSVWRESLKEIVDSFVQDKFPPQNTFIPLGEFDNDIIEINRTNITKYPDKLGPLNPKSWESSIYLWMGGYWEVLVDLSDEFGNTTDLVFHANIKEKGAGFQISPYLIYVP